MTQKVSSSNIASLQDILSYYDEWLLLPTSLYQQKPHPHQTFLAWLLKNTAPKKIAIFDTAKENTQTTFCNLTHVLNLTSECYGNIKQENNNLLPKTLIPLTTEIHLSSFSLIYIDISNQIIKNDPILSLLEINIPKDSIFIFNNLYSQNSIAKENRKLIHEWKKIYSFFEFTHHQGLLLLYTGNPASNILNELLSLKSSPKLEHVFKTQCALQDEYWQLKLNSIQAKRISNKEKIIEAKTETYLLQQEIYYQEKKNNKEINSLKVASAKEIQLLQEKINHLSNKIEYIEEYNKEEINSINKSDKEKRKNIELNNKKEINYIKQSYNNEVSYLLSNYKEKINYIRILANTDFQYASNNINQLSNTIDSLWTQLQAYRDAHHEVSLWQKNIETQTNSIHYFLKKHRFISFFIPKKLKQLFKFSSAPNFIVTSLPSTPEKKSLDFKLSDFLKQNEDELNFTFSSEVISEIPSELNLTEPQQLIPTKSYKNITPFIPEPIVMECPNRDRRIIFVAGEPNTPGAIYRCYRNAEACIMAGHEAKVINAANISPGDIQWADILILWRVEFSGHILGIVEVSKEFNTLTAFDADDIVFKPHFAYIEIIDGIRTIGTTEAETSRTFGNMKQTLMRTDFAVATTQEMREHMAQEMTPKHAGPLVFTLPNIFDDDCVRISRFFSRINKANKNDNYIRIGYASGTRTHQRDFGLVIPALLEIFKKRPQVRLVLFREPENHRPILHMNEFPELNDFQDRIEWRDTVPLKQLPQELARFDISIAPLEAENIFCNAKSELKFFEAALANVCSVVSPTGPLSRCVQHGITGFLAKNTEEWEEYLLQLVDDPSLRKKMARDAYHDVLWNFSTQRQSHLCDTMLLSLTNEKGAAQAMETMIARKDYKNLSMPIIPESELLFDHDALLESEVTVVITSYNYSNFIIEAMESVKRQTLKHIDMIIVDDGSSDDSVELITSWAMEHKNRFNRLQLHRSLKNVGLGGARNIGISASETLYSMQLDADNRLLPDSCEKLLAKMQGTAIGYAYPHLRHFGAGEATGGHIPFHPLRLTVGNYIDAMVMLAKWAWAAAGGYYVQRDAMGWEDYDIWCRLAELGIQGTQVKDAIAEYRAHSSSMTNTVTEQTYHKPKVTSYLAERHPWVKIVLPEDSPWVKKKK